MSWSTEKGEEITEQFKCSAKEGQATFDFVKIEENVNIYLL
jgi:hypothetical protein